MSVLNLCFQRSLVRSTLLYLSSPYRIPWIKSQNQAARDQYQQMARRYVHRQDGREYRHPEASQSSVRFQQPKNFSWKRLNSIVFDRPSSMLRSIRIFLDVDTEMIVRCRKMPIGFTAITAVSPPTYNSSNVKFSGTDSGTDISLVYLRKIAINCR